MADKKDPGKFTVRFNIHDPQHQTVVALLNQQGRNKAQFLASAVLHYINCKETPNLQVPPVDPETLEKIIVSILEKRDKQKRGGGVPQCLITCENTACLRQGNRPCSFISILFKINRRFSW